MDQANLSAVKKYFLALQENICQALSKEDGQGHFISDNWQREQGGGGCSRNFINGRVIEKGGVNFSHISGDQLPAAATNKHPELQGCHFQALGVSVVIHPVNPYVPTTHFNVR